MFSIELSIQSKKFLKKSNKQLAMRIIEKIELLKGKPVMHDSKKIIGENRAFRIRIGDYRVLSAIRDTSNNMS